jgi:hypothetical protein
VPGGMYALWDNEGDAIVIDEFLRIEGSEFRTKRGPVYYHIARIDHLTKVPTSVDELKELAGEGNWL